MSNENSENRPSPELIDQIEEVLQQVAFEENPLKSLHDHLESIYQGGFFDGLEVAANAIGNLLRLPEEHPLAPIWNDMCATAARILSQSVEGARIEWEASQDVD